MNAPEITIENTTPLHLRIMADVMQENMKILATHMGIAPHKALWDSYRRSLYCKTIFIDCEIAAIFGLEGEVFGDTGKPWLVLTPSVEDYPFKTAFVYKQELKKMQEMFSVLEEYVPADNEKSIRLLVLMGFKISKNEVKVGEQTFIKAERRA